MSASPGIDHEAVELALKWHGISVADLAPVWGIRVTDRWMDHPLIADFLVLTAVQVITRRKRDQGASRTAALKSACEELGLNYRTIHSRLVENWKRYLTAIEHSTEVDGIPVQTARIAR